nr:reverse transcriptase domain-containing protein [Tanacetum cinerariifolium]
LSSDRRADRPEVTLPPRKRLSIVHCSRYEAGESSVAAAARPIEGRRTEIFQRVEAVVDDSQYHYETGRLVDQEARCSQEAWAHFIRLSATSNPNQAPSTTTTTVTNAQLQAIIDQGVNVALVARDANRTGDDSHTSGTGVRRTERELALLCVRTCPEESDRVERYIGGLPDSIHESVPASKPKTMQEATEMATRLMDKKIRTYAERQAANKRKFEDTSRNNQGQQQPPKRQDVARAYAAGSGNRQQYVLAVLFIRSDGHSIFPSLV